MSEIQSIPLDQIKPSADASRSEMDELALEYLAASIEQKGVLQPVILAKRGEGFIVVAGARRVAASQLADKPTIPAIVVELSDEDIPIIALHENLFREEINAIDEALSLHALEEKYKISRNKIAKMLGKSPAYITQKLDILQWPEQLRNALRENQISFSVARELSRIDDQDKLEYYLKAAMESGATVRTISLWVQEHVTSKKSAELVKELKPAGAKDLEIKADDILHCFCCGSGPRDDVVYYPLCPDCADFLSLTKEDMPE